MQLSEVYNENKKVLNRALYIQNLLEGVLNKGVSLTDDIVNCGDAYLYYTSTASLTAQAKAPLGERFLCNLLGYTRVSSREDRGDAVDKEGIYYEFKNSFTNQRQNLNIRQIRLWQNVDYYYCFYINEEDLDKSVFFILTKDEMIKEVVLCGGYTHGTLTANAVNEHNEYSITIPIYNDKNEKTKRWKEKYLSNELKNKILGGK